MSRLIFGIVLSFAAAWLGVVLYSYLTLARLEPVIDSATGDSMPPALSGLAIAGEQIYAANGCVYCHSQQVRAPDISSDIEKKVGSRRTVARDYLHEQPAFLGQLRIGPDLSNYALRAPSANAIHLLLYEGGVAMPAYRDLYKLRRISGQPAYDALSGLRNPPPPGYEVVPTDDARALAAYLLSLRRDYPLTR